MTARQEKLILVPPMLLAAGVFLIGINWGLPSRKVDPFLFGQRPVWSGSQIAGMLNDSASTVSLGADVDVNPVKLRPVVINDTDAGAPRSSSVIASTAINPMR